MGVRAQACAALLLCLATSGMLLGGASAVLTNPLPLPNGALADTARQLSQPKVADQLTAAAVTAGAVISKNAQLLTDVDIMNFLLNVEYLAANFWSCAAFGVGLNAMLRGGGPPALGCSKATLTPLTQAIVAEVAYDEISHVMLLRGLLGPLAVPQPLINLGAVSVFINAAVRRVLVPPFNPALSDMHLLIGGFLISDVEPSGYKGAVTLLTSKQFLAVGAGLLGTESHHAGVLRSMLVPMTLQPVPSYPTFTVNRFIQSISDLRDVVDGVVLNVDQGITLAGLPNLVPTDTNGLIFTRTPQQVLSILYNSRQAGGGFFPFGFNGRIR